MISLSPFETQSRAQPPNTAKESEKVGEILNVKIFEEIIPLSFKVTKKLGNMGQPNVEGVSPKIPSPFCPVKSFELETPRRGNAYTHEFGTMQTVSDAIVPATQPFPYQMSYG